MAQNQQTFVHAPDIFKVRYNAFPTAYGSSGKALGSCSPMSLIDIWIMQELAVVMAKHGYRPTEEEAETVLKIRRGRSHRVHLQAHFLHSSHLLHVCPRASDGTCVLRISSCSVTEISKMRAGLMGGALTYGLSGLTRLRHHRYARPIHPSLLCIPTIMRPFRLLSPCQRMSPRLLSLVSQGKVYTGICFLQHWGVKCHYCS